MKTEKINLEIKTNAKPLLNDLRKINKEIQNIINPTRNTFKINDVVFGILLGIGISCLGIIIFMIINS